MISKNIDNYSIYFKIPKSTHSLVVNTLWPILIIYRVVVSWWTYSNTLEQILRGVLQNNPFSLFRLQE